MSKPDPLTLLAAGLAEAKAARATIDRAITALEQAIQQGVQDGMDAIPQVTVEASEHRRLHRPGPVPKIDADPDLQSFILARVDSMAFVDIAADVAKHFPESRRVGKSAIYGWWCKQNRR